MKIGAQNAVNIVASVVIIANGATQTLVIVIIAKSAGKNFAAVKINTKG